MKTKYKTILMFFLVLIGISLSYSQGWAGDRLNFQRDIFYSCTKQGPNADTTVEVIIRYVRKQVGDDKYIWEPVQLTVSDRSLIVRKVSQPHIWMEEEYPSNPDAVQVRAGKIAPPGPPDSMNCTENNYPIVAVGGQIFFIEEKTIDIEGVQSILIR